MGFPVSLLLCDAAGDRLGGTATAAIDAAVVGVGFPRRERRRRPSPAAHPLPGYLAPVLDDAVEDVFKYLCVASHAAIGSALGSQLLQGLHTVSWLPRNTKAGAALLLTVGVPLGQYSECNSWGDHLGDVAKHALFARDPSAAAASPGPAPPIQGHGVVS